MDKETRSMEFRVHTPNLLKEIFQNNPSMGILRIPIQQFGNTLYAVGKRAAELNDPELNKLMIQLTLYEQADPESKHYDPDLVNEFLNK